MNVRGGLELASHTKLLLQNVEDMEDLISIACKDGGTSKGILGPIVRHH
jgi:hypothetical protein